MDMFCASRSFNSRPSKGAGSPESLDLHLPTHHANACSTTTRSCATRSNASIRAAQYWMSSE